MFGVVPNDVRTYLDSAAGAASLSPPPNTFMAVEMVTPQAASTAITMCSSFHSPMDPGFSQQLYFTSPWASADGASSE